MTRTDIVKPEVPSGFRDYLPQEMIQRQAMLDTIRRVYESFGFSPLETPAVERTECLLGRDKKSSMVIFNTSLSRAEPDDPQELSLRFDLTVPLARVVAANIDTLPRPFRRYQCGKVWRGEKPQAGRFREFMQFDADIVGAASMMADAEIMMLMWKTMAELGFSRFMIRFNNRKILNALAQRLGLKDISGEQGKELFRVIDKLEKIGWDGVSEELKRPPDNEFDLVSLALSDENVDVVRRFVETSGTPEEVLAALPGILGDGSYATQGVAELKEIVEYLTAAEVPRENWAIDLSVARGLDYYTGPVFETTLLDLPSIGSVFSGGRYDDLVSRFSDATPCATGASIGVDRLFAAMEKLKLLQGRKTVTDVLIMDVEASCRPTYFQIARKLRDAGFCVEIYSGEQPSFKAQLAYATKLEIPYVVIYGGREAATRTVAVKDMVARAQKGIPLDDLVAGMRSLRDSTISG